ncbi:MAG: DMT family transporter [Polyangiaceae bacterium]|nr:DMT family transporter [Polyangiaceae bacterium]
MPTLEPAAGHAAFRARLALVAAAVCFSTGGAAIKATSLTAFQVAGLRSLIAAVAVAVLLPGALRGITLRSAAIGAGYAFTLILFVSGNKLTTAANTIFLQSTAPLWVLLASPALLGESLRRSDVAFLALAALGLGCFFVGVEPPRVTAPDPLTGNVLATASGVTWALTIMGLRWLGSRAGARPGEAGGAVVVGNLVAFGLCLPWTFPLAATVADWGVLLFLGVFQIGLAYALMTRGLAGVRALEASLLLLVEPVLNPVWAFLLHREVPGSWAIAGAVLVIAGTSGRAAAEALSRRRGAG